MFMFYYPVDHPAGTDADGKANNIENGKKSLVPEMPEHGFEGNVHGCGVAWLILKDDEQHKRRARWASDWITVEVRVRSVFTFAKADNTVTLADDSLAYLRLLSTWSWILLNFFIRLLIIVVALLRRSV